MNLVFEYLAFGQMRCAMHLKEAPKEVRTKSFIREMKKPDQMYYMNAPK